jgi:ATP phosphoribosyltransferase regulatory subunit HisZ
MKHKISLPSHFEDALREAIKTMEIEGVELVVNYLGVDEKLPKSEQLILDIYFHEPDMYFMLGVKLGVLLQMGSAIKKYKRGDNIADIVENQKDYDMGVITRFEYEERRKEILSR